MNLQSKSVLICDHGLYVSLALRMAREYGRVGYHNLSWKRGFPGFEEHDIGTGFDEIKHEPDFFKAVDRYDLIWFPDILNGDIQPWMRSKKRPDGSPYRVFGSGEGDELELYRIYLKKVMEEAGLPVNEYRVVKGVEALRDFLAHNKGWHVKISKFRGISETFHSEEGWLTDPRLDELAHNLKTRKDTQEFLCEKDIETHIEYGYDGICIDGQFPDLGCNGVEKKDVAYACVVQPYKRLPEGMRQVNAALVPILGAYSYRNFFSTEIRLTEDGTPYLIDLTCRQPSPAGESQQELWSNLGEVAFNGAEGKLTQFKPTAKYAVQSIICGDRADESSTPIKFPEEFRDNVKLFFECRKDGHSYVIPQPDMKMKECGSVVTVGDKLEDVIAQNKEISKAVKGDKICIRTDQIDAVIEEFEEMKGKGIDIEPYSS